MVYKFIKMVLLLVVFFIVKIEVRNLNKFPQDGSLVIASNHLSMWDPVIIGVALPRKIHFMAKEELFKISFLKLIMKSIGTFPVKRGSADRHAIRESLKILQNQGVLCIFPEGTRSWNGQLQNFHPGVSMIAYKGKSPIIPVGITGTDKILKNIFQRTKVIVNIGEPIFVGQNREVKMTGQEIDDFTKVLHNKVKKLAHLKQDI